MSKSRPLAKSPLRPIALLSWAMAMLFAAPALAAEKPIAVHMVIVTAFEIGKDTGDIPGEFQAWAEQMPQAIPFPEGPRPLRYDPVRKILLLSTGIGTGRAAVSTMALGHDPRFDLSRAYWLVAAIAGVNPNMASIGSAAWIGRVVDTDLGYAIDAREIPAGWPTGLFPLDRKAPYQQPVPQDTSGNLFTLNLALRAWAVRLTAGLDLPDSADLKRIRASYAAFPRAITPPSILAGDEATGQAFWHGALLNDHAERWVKYWTHDEGHFAMTGMEDSGIARALQTLTTEHRADASRLLILRTASNYTVPPAGKDAAASLAAESQELTGLRAALDAAHRVGGMVVDEITGHWDRYRDTVPAPILR